MRRNPPCLSSRYAWVTAVNVFPAPVAICTRDRSNRPSARERSIPPIAVTCAGRKPSTGKGGRVRTFPRQVGATSSASTSRSVLARVSGRGNANRARARGVGSNPFVKCVSEPEASNTNGNRPSRVTAFRRTCGGRPVAYIADCHSTPESGVPSGLASITPTARWSTYSR